MSSKNNYILFGVLVAAGVLVISMFAMQVINPSSTTWSGKQKNTQDKDVFVTIAPGVEKTSRIPAIERKDPVTGNPDGEITIVEFADFECQPFCADAQKTLNELQKTYPDKIRLVWKNYPLEWHAFSQKAAEAVLCANEQGKFEAMRDILFAKQSISLLPSNIKEYAKNIGLNAEKFNACFDGGLNADAVARDKATGVQFGVSAVPYFFFYKTATPEKGYNMSWAGTAREFQAVIDVLLAEKENP